MAKCFSVFIYPGGYPPAFLPGLWSWVPGKLIPGIIRLIGKKAKGEVKTRVIFQLFFNIGKNHVGLIKIYREMSDRLLEIRDLSICFTADHQERVVVDHVSLHLDKSETLAIVGESGSGKTVTALSVLRLIPSPPGKISGGENQRTLIVLSLSDRIGVTAIFFGGGEL